MLRGYLDVKRIRELKAKERLKSREMTNRIGYMTRKADQNEKNVGWAEAQLQKLQRNKQEYLSKRISRRERDLAVERLQRERAERVRQLRSEWSASRKTALAVHTSRVRSGAETLRLEKSQLSRQVERTRQ
jgi:hypothetical protein